MDGSTLNCTCILETTDQCGVVLKKQVVKKATLDLGRNEFGDVVLKVSYPEGKQGPFTVRDYKIHKKFLKDGKATIHLITQRLQLMLSNSPPEQLRLFMISLVMKLTARGAKQGKRQLLTGTESNYFDEISPLTIRDLEMAKRNNLPGVTNKENIITTPNRVESFVKKPAMKRKLCEIQLDIRNSSEVEATNPPAKKPLLLNTSKSSLCEEQIKVIDMVKNGENVFFTGSAGTGKSFLLRRIISTLPPETTYITASTGAAACLIGGSTLHSFAGIGSGEGSLEQCFSLASREHKAIHWRRCKCLIVDEISMVDGQYFDKLEAIARGVRKSKKPFGGIQLVLCGDFLQLPPVCRDGQKKIFCFQANCWRRCITRSMELTQIYRQNDKQFIAVLQNIRIGRCPPAVTKLLKSTETQRIETGDIKPTKLYTHTEDVESTNQKELRALTSESRKYTATDSNPNLTKQISSLCPAPHILELKLGVQVMLVKNIDVSKSLVNGARGIVTQFNSQGFPVVQFTSGRQETIGSEKWVFNIGGGTTVSRKQLPLTLAWAISIHKSQGMTLDCVEISLARAFEKGQAYVALSRAKSLQTVRVLDFNPACVQADSEVLDYYRSLRRMRKHYIN